MFSFLKRKQSQNSCLGVGFHQDGISLALAVRNQKNDISLKHLEYRSVSGAEAIPVTLSDMVSQSGLKDVPVVFVMDRANYSVLQVEVPEVSQEEMKNAVRWRIKDLLDFHIDDAVIELIMLPQSRRAGSPRLMYVVAARAAYIQEVVDQFESVGLQINAIDVAELALRNMTFADAEESRAQALLYLSRNLNLIEVCDSGCLYLSRQINLGGNGQGFNAAGGQVETMDMLGLEVQRSIDYYESQFASGAVSKLHVVVEDQQMLDSFNNMIDDYLALPIKKLSALDAIKGLNVYDQQLVASCMPSIGGALRNFAWTS